ncbi:SHOCT domain-containing protein [Tepidibacter aestuarii]|uniref:SHOCT domain-containing protein n=1 Tax=Tepidibacter aestuarii TaxID=2925782 RepID=UPI0020BFC7C3|nr:SHOCT domain-containing protein [Tepidibacter aestuarii]CAH2212222.1 putative membrane protein [Tepidibacter aestuarii]
MMVFLLFIVVLIIYLLNNNSLSYNKRYNESDKAIEILKEKYAKGEITEEEYKHKLKILNS